MKDLLDYLVLLLSQFAGGPGRPENNLMRFGLAAVFWGVLLVVAYSRQRQKELPRERLLVWGFGLGLARELFMFIFVSLQILRVLERESAYCVSAPLEQTVAMAAVVVVAGSFLRYILDDAFLSRRYLQIGLGTTAACYLATFWWWAGYSTANPEQRFGQTWPAWIFGIASVALMGSAIALLVRKRGWLRNLVLVALLFFFLDDFLMLINVATGEVYTQVFCPLSHSLHILAIPLLGYVYIREQGVERELAVKALSESEERFRGVIENAQAGYFFMDRQGLIRNVNEAWLRMHGYSSAEEVVGQSYRLVQVESDLDQARRDLEKLLSGEAISAGEFTRRCKDGSIGYHTSSTHPVVQGGEVVGVEGFLIDRSQWVRAEKEVWHRNRELVILNAIAAIISQPLDLDQMLDAILGKVLIMVNMEAGWIQLLDEGGESLSIAAWRGFALSADTAPPPVRLDAGPAGEVVRSGESIVMSPAPELLCLGAIDRPDDSGLVFLGVPIKVRDHVLGVLGMLGRDEQELDSPEVQLLTAIAHQVGVAVENARLTEEASQARILQEVDRLRSELIANVSHELRTPLGLIKLSCTSLLAEDVQFEAVIERKILQGIEDETGRLETIVDSLLDLSRIESGRLQLQKRRVPVAELVERVIKSMGAKALQHRLVHQPASRPLTVVVDPKQIEQVLRNLLSNAIKYSPEGGTVTLSYSEKDGRLTIAVEDQGIGIPVGELERVFDRFYRVDNPTMQKVHGVGLGLAVSRSIVEAHGGQISVESSPGQGSRFAVVLPEDMELPESEHTGA